MEDLSRKFKHFFEVISSKGFLSMESLGGEIPFFIAAYHAEQEIEMRHAIGMLRKRLENQGIPVLDLNLYDISCEIMEERGGVDRMFSVEKAKSKEKFLKALQSTLNIHQVLMPKISEKIAQSDAKVYFLTGIGLVFPFIRSHNILNNLQNIAKEAPTVAFFPGQYNGHSLRLFGKLLDDNYYRAFNIEHVETEKS